MQSFPYQYNPAANTHALHQSLSPINPYIPMLFSAMQRYEYIYIYLCKSVGLPEVGWNHTKEIECVAFRSFRYVKGAQSVLMITAAT